MKHTLTLLSLAFLSITACKDGNNIEVKKAHDSSGRKLNVKVVNEFDPICNMDTDHYLSDTAVYKGDIYGFCSPSCKEEFKKYPESYLLEY